MGAYNIVGATTLVAGQPEDVSQVLANFAAIQAVLNGGIDNSNINAAAAIGLGKLAQAGATVGQSIAWTGATWAPGGGSVPGGAAGQILAYPAGILTALTPAFTLATPADPPGTSSTTRVMMGLAASITPVFSGRIDLSFSGAMSSPGNGFVEARYGTGGAPGNGAGPSGTASGKPVMMNIAGGKADGYTIRTILSGLTVGTAYWLDLAYWAPDGSTTVPSSLTVAAHEF